MQPPVDHEHHNVQEPAVKGPHNGDDGGVAERLGRLPAGVGVVLLGVGIGGLVFPGPFGMPFLVASGLVLMPRMFKKPDRWLQRCFPNGHRHGARLLDRFITDLANRYPDSDSAQNCKTQTQSKQQEN